MGIATGLGEGEPHGLGESVDHVPTEHRRGIVPEQVTSRAEAVDAAGHLRPEARLEPAHLVGRGEVDGMEVQPHAAAHGRGGGTGGCDHGPHTGTVLTGTPDR